MDFGQELPNSLNEIINGLEGSAIILRLEVLYETVLINGEVPLDAIDLIDHAHKQLIANQNFHSILTAIKHHYWVGMGSAEDPSFRYWSNSYCFWAKKRITSLFLVCGIFHHFCFATVIRYYTLKIYAYYRYLPNNFFSPFKTNGKTGRCWNGLSDSLSFQSFICMFLFNSAYEILIAINTFSFII